MMYKTFINADPNIISLALYGSYADGSFDEKSDVDILAITTSKQEVLLPAIHNLEDKVGKEVNVTTFKLFEWRKMADQGDEVYNNLINLHILLYGSGIK